jgi:hypothetical protein
MHVLLYLTSNCSLLLTKRADEVTKEFLNHIILLRLVCILRPLLKPVYQPLTRTSYKPAIITASKDPYLAGWAERFEPLRCKPLFWHEFVNDCGRPRLGVVADCMLLYQSAFRWVKIVYSVTGQKLISSVINDTSLDCWAEV